MLTMVVTLLTSHSPKGLLKVYCDMNNEFMFVTRLTSHALIEVELTLAGPPRSTAVLNCAPVMFPTKKP